MWKLDRLLTCKSVDQAQQEKDPASLKKHDCLILLLALLSSGLPFYVYSWPFLAFFFVSIAWQYLSRCFQKSGYFAPVFGHFFFCSKRILLLRLLHRRNKTLFSYRVAWVSPAFRIHNFFFNQSIGNFFFRSTLLALSQKKLKELADVFTFWVDQFFSLYTFH